MGTESSASEGRPRSEGGGDESCKCYCLVNWIGPIAAPYIPSGPTTVVTSWFVFQTDIETGDEYWSANVNEKSYVCDTQQVLGVNPQVLQMLHNTYQMTRTRYWFFGWSAWTPWGAAVNTGNLTNAQALGTSSPPALPECTAVGIACP